VFDLCQFAIDLVKHEADTVLYEFSITHVGEGLDSAWALLYLVDVATDPYYNEISEDIDTVEIEESQRGYLQDYHTQYLNSVVEHFNVDQSTDLAITLLRMNQFSILKAMPVTADAKDAIARAHKLLMDYLCDESLKDSYNSKCLARHLRLIIRYLPFIDINHTIAAHNRLHTTGREYPLQLADHIYFKLLMEKLNHESEDNYLDRIAAVILLDIVYDTIIPRFAYFQKLMQQQNDDKESFEEQIQQHPDQYCRALIRICQIDQRTNIMRQSVLHTMLFTAWERSIVENKPLDEKDTQAMLWIISELPIGILIEALQPHDSHCFRKLLSAYGYPILEYAIEAIMKNVHCNDVNKRYKQECAFSFLHKVIETTKLNQDQLDLLLLRTVQYFKIVNFAIFPDSRQQWFKSLIQLGANPLKEKTAKSKIVRKVDPKIAEQFQFYSREECPLVILMQSPGGFAFEHVLNQVRAGIIKLDFAKLHSYCNDPLGLAVRCGAKHTIFELMLDVGFDVERFQMPTDLSMDPHISLLIIQRLQALLRSRPPLQFAHNLQRDFPGMRQDSKPKELVEETEQNCKREASSSP
nr:hypothetical protein [Pseudomonadota bacterium]